MFKSETINKQNISNNFMKEMFNAYAKYLRYLRPHNPKLQELKDGLQILNAAIEEVNSAYNDPVTGFEIFLSDDIQVGFAFIGMSPNAYGINDIYIQEFCIYEQFQRKGYGTKAVEQITQKWPDYDISLFILKENDPAKKFWNKTMENLGYREKVREGMIIPPDSDIDPEGAGKEEPITFFQYWKK